MIILEVAHGMGGWVEGTHRLVIYINTNDDGLNLLLICHDYDNMT